MKTATLLSVGLGLLAGWFWGDEVILLTSPQGGKCICL
jgi:hypothetical protein